MNSPISSPPPDVVEQPMDAVFDVLASDTRRMILGLLHEHGPSPIPIHELARRVCAWKRGTAPDAVTDDDRRLALSELYHVQIPKLAAVGLIDRTDRGEIVANDEHPAFRDPTILDLIDPRTDDRPPGLNPVFRALADNRRREVLYVLGQQFHPIQVETLAEELVARELGTTEHEAPSDAVDRLLIELHHVHLPMLLDAGLIGRDDVRNTFHYEGHPSIPVRWLRSHVGPVDEILASDRRTGDVSTITGYENVITYGQSLCERADEELFMMFTTTGLLEQGSFARIRDALDRGVAVYLGTRDPTVRDAVRARLPEVVLWEPRSDWLSIRPDGDGVGRLVFADREAIMLAALDRRDDRGVYEETAVVGEGASNGLVVLVSQILGSRIDQLDWREENRPSRLSS